MVQTIKIILPSATKTWALSWVDSEKYQISNLYPPKKMQDWVHITLCTYICMGKLWTLVEEFRHSMYVTSISSCVNDKENDQITMFIRDFKARLVIVGGSQGRASSLS